MNIGGSELLVILIVALLIFGPKELPKVGRSIGSAVREFRQVSQSFTRDLGLSRLLEEDKPELEKPRTKE